MIAPVSYAADEAAAKAAFEALGKMDVSDLVTDQKAKQAEFEVDDKAGVHVVAKAAGGKVLADFIVGKVVGGGTMVRLAGQGRGLAGQRASRKFIVDKTPTDWRDKSITTFHVRRRREARGRRPRTTARSCSRRPAPRRGAEDKWEIVESTSRRLAKIDTLDNAVPNGIVSTLSTWKANDFADGAKPADDRPRRAGARR